MTTADLQVRGQAFSGQEWQCTEALLCEATGPGSKLNTSHGGLCTRHRA